MVIPQQRKYNFIVNHERQDIDNPWEKGMSFMPIFLFFLTSVVIF